MMKCARLKPNNTAPSGQLDFLFHVPLLFRLERTFSLSHIELKASMKAVCHSSGTWWKSTGFSTFLPMILSTEATLDPYCSAWRSCVPCGRNCRRLSISPARNQLCQPCRHSLPNPDKVENPEWKAKRKRTTEDQVASLHPKRNHRSLLHLHLQEILALPNLNQAA